MTRLTIEKILETALKLEEQSQSLYTTAQRKAKYPSSKKFLKELAQEELKHKEKLLAIAKNKAKLDELGKHEGKVQDLKIVDYMEDTPLSADADYATILIYAAKREKSTYEYYNHLASGLEGTDSGKLFAKLAQEELIHKSKLETEYDEHFLKEN
jgi:rubrerythrin